jgi:hypothetical protein
MKRLITITLILIFTLTACFPASGGSSGNTSGQPASEKRCGDGVCDGPENTSNCPQDCETGGGAPQGGDTGSGQTGSVTYNIIEVSPSSEKGYFGVCGDNQPTEVSILARFKPDTNVAAVTLEYYYHLRDAIKSETFQASMNRVGEGKYVVDVDIGSEAGGTLVSSDGTLYFTATIEDSAGGTTTSTESSMPVIFCGALQPEG